MKEHQKYVEKIEHLNFIGSNRKDSGSQCNKSAITNHANQENVIDRQNGKILDQNSDCKRKAHQLSHLYY